MGEEKNIYNNNHHHHHHQKQTKKSQNQTKPNQTAVESYWSGTKNKENETAVWF